MVISSEMQLFIDQYQLKKVDVRGGELWCLCPFHDDRHPNNFSINLTTGNYFCFACLMGGHIVQYGHMIGLDYKKILNLWEIVRKDEKIDIKFPSPPLDRFLVDYYKKFGRSKYALSRMDLKTLEDYNVFSDETGNPIFFIVDFHGDYRAVWVRDEILIPNYYLIEPVSAKRDGFLFGEHLPITDYTVLTEGFFDAMSFWQDLGQVGVCINGLWLTNNQVKMLEKMQPLYLFTDGDVQGRAARNKIYNKLKHLDVYICGGYNGDADELSKEKKLEIISKAKNKIEWELYIK